MGKCQSIKKDECSWQVVDESFKADIEFAEKYLKSQSIDFLEWCNINAFLKYTDANNMYWSTVLSTEYVTTEALFNLYLKEK